jgi:uncharacterized membrane protein
MPRACFFESKNGDYTHEVHASHSHERYAEIDLLRTIAILLMVVYHALFDLAMFYRFPLDPLSNGWLLLERFTAHLFLLLVGISFAISASHVKQKGNAWKTSYAKYARRGIGLLICAECISLATFIVDPATYVRFGVLHLIALSAFILPFFLSAKEWNALLGITIILMAPFVQNMRVLTSLFLPLGLMPPSFASVDYFPFFPWFGTILIGVAIGHFLYVRNNTHSFAPLRRRIPPWTTSPGKHALWIYMLHQPVIICTLWILFG